MENVTETVQTAAVEVKQVEQKEAIFNFVKELVGELAEGQTYAQVLDTKGEDKEKARKLRKAIKEKLIEGIKAGSVSYNKDVSDEKKLKNTCSSTVSNWLKKDKRYS